MPAKPYSYLPATSGRGERVSNGLPGQTVKGRGCNTEEGGCFGNAEAPDDDHLFGTSLFWFAHNQPHSG
ncbi:hypothetical protein [Phocaeicola massiliensis]|uniref:hypothetical protein n=1 Tax=Phocaeicola massiliensis TaxID=204516 RepID=UPI0022E01CBF|nr:hypothetical protein [Phocaeicola massiliensis]